MARAAIWFDIILYFKYNKDMTKYLFIFMSLAVLLTACGGQQSPRQVTMEFVGSVIEDDSLAIEELLDIEMMVEYRLKEIPPTDSAQTPEYFRNRIIQNLTGDGGTRQLWKEHRLVVNDEAIVGDTAHVELTLMDQERGIIQYLLVYLYRTPDGAWRVFKYL